MPPAIIKYTSSCKANRNNSETTVHIRGRARAYTHTHTHTHTHPTKRRHSLDVLMSCPVLSCPHSADSCSEVSTLCGASRKVEMMMTYEWLRLALHSSHQQNIRKKKKSKKPFWVRSTFVKWTVLTCTSVLYSSFELLSTKFKCPQHAAESAHCVIPTGLQCWHLQRNRNTLIFTDRPRNR